MSGVNKVIIVGRLGNDPEMKAITSGQNVTRFNVATSENWTDKSGQRQERTEWHRVVVWGKLGENCARHLSKGRQVFVEGRLQSRSWDDPQGNKRYTTEVIAQNVQFLGSQADRSSTTTESSNDSAQEFGPEPSFDPADEIPF